MKKILVLTLCFMMIFSTSAFADAYDALFYDMNSYSAVSGLSLAFDNADGIFSALGEDGYGSETLDTELLFSQLFNTSGSSGVKFNANDDYTAFTYSLESNIKIPVKLNNNFALSAEMKIGLWVKYDVTDEGNPVFEMILSTPDSKKYKVADVIGIMSDYGSDVSEITTNLKAVINKEKINELREATKTILKNNSSLKVSGSKSVITVSKQQFLSFVQEVAGVYEELEWSAALADVYAEMSAALIGVLAVDEENDADFSIDIEIWQNPNGSAKKANVIVNMKAPLENAGRSDEAISFSVIQNMTLSDINRNIPIDFPELTAENSVDYNFDAYVYDYSGRWSDMVSVYCTYVPSAPSSLYVPLGDVIRELEMYEFEYSLTNNDGNITLTDKGDDEEFDIAQMNIASNVLYVDGTQYKMTNPPIISGGKLYVDNTALKYIFDLDFSSGETNLIENMTDVTFSRQYQNYVEDYYSYDEEFDDEFFYCDHFQYLWMYADTPELTGDYFPLRAAIDNHLYTNSVGQQFDLCYDDGVVTIREYAGLDNFSAATVTVGSNVITVDGTIYETELPTVNAGGTVYVDAIAIEKLLGFRLAQRSIVYEGGYTDEETGEFVPLTSYKSADFERKNPACVHEYEDVKYQSIIR